MKKQSISPTQTQLLLALASFLVWLLADGAYLLLEVLLGGARAYFWYLSLFPVLFVLYALCAGFFAFRFTGRLWHTVLFQTLALFCARLCVLLAELFSARLSLSALFPSVALFEFTLLLSGLVLLTVGARVSRFLCQRRAARALQKEIAAKKSDTTPSSAE